MPTQTPENPTENDLKAVAKYLLQTSYDDGVGNLTLERSDNGFTGRFSDATDPKKIMEYTLEKSGDSWELGYIAVSGVEDTDDFSEVEVEPIWNESPFEFAETEVDPADQYTEQAIALAAPIFSEWLETLEDHIFDGATDLGEVRDRIDSAFGEMKSEDFAELMQSVLVAGYGAGRYQVQTEAEDDDAEFSEDTEDFAEIPNNAISITDKSALALLKRLIDSVYLAGITAIKYAYVDSQDNIRCGFEDKISANKTLSFDGKFNSTLISYGISNTALSEWDEPDSVISFAAPATIKPRNCNPAKSFQCGNSCQKLGRNCKKNPNSGQKGAIAQIVESTKVSAPLDRNSDYPVSTTAAERKAYANLLESADRGYYLTKGQADLVTLNDAPPPYAEELAAVQAYSSNYHKQINQMLREDPANLSPIKELKQHTKLATAALDALPSYDGVVYRGTKMTREVIDSYTTGQVVVEKGFTSTSENLKRAKLFSKVKNKTDLLLPVLYTINSKNGKSIKALSRVGSEEEVLFRPASQFKVLDKKIKNGITHIYMEEN